MKQNVQKHNRMKLWIGVAIIIALFIAVLFYGMYLYRTTINSKYVDVSKTKNFILENNYLESIEEMDAFYEAETYHIFRSEEHTSELQSRGHLVCRLLLEKKNCRS